MSNLKDIRLRIASVTSTRQITSAMKMVSAAKLRKAQDAIIQMRPYANKLFEIFTGLCKSLDENIGKKPAKFPGVRGKNPISTKIRQLTVFRCFFSQLCVCLRLLILCWANVFTVV